MKLAYVTPGPLDQKAIDGISEFAKTWPGDISVVSSFNDMNQVMFNVVRTTDALSALTRIGPDVVTALHRPKYAFLTRAFKTVYTCEYDRRMRVMSTSIGVPSRIKRARIVAGSYRAERLYAGMARAAAGIQCNGYSAWDAYAPVNKMPMRFREHRIRNSDLALARERPVWQGDRPLRVAFSGRLIAIKGPGLVLEIAARLPHIDFEIIGDGPLLRELRATAPANVRFAGFIPFPDWPRYVRQNVDLAVLPHPQGDPSGTYHEMLGCGVPVLGQANPTWLRLAEQDGLGWAAFSADEFVAIIEQLTPAELDRVRTHALAILESFETVAAYRVAHLVRVANL